MHLVYVEMELSRPVESHLDAMIDGQSPRSGAPGKVAVAGEMSGSRQHLPNEDDIVEKGGPTRTLAHSIIRLRRQH
jgi:hypothetical protein